MVGAELVMRGLRCGCGPRMTHSGRAVSQHDRRIVWGGMGGGWPRQVGPTLALRSPLDRQPEHAFLVQPDTGPDDRNAQPDVA